MIKNIENFYTGGRRHRNIQEEISDFENEFLGFERGMFGVESGEIHRKMRRFERKLRREWRGDYVSDVFLEDDQDDEEM